MIVKNLAHNKNKLAFDYYQRIRELRKKQGLLAIEMGKYLKEVKEKKLYRYLGEGGYENFQQFLADPEININYHTAQLYIRVYEFYIERLNLPPEELTGIPLNRLNTIKSKLEELEKEKKEDEIKEWIEKAKVLGRLDFEEELREAKIIKRQKPYKIVKCKHCDKIKIIIISPDELCQCQ